MKTEVLHTDIAIIGGGQAGVCAAIAAAQEGRKTILITDRPVLGGNASSECGVPPHGAEAIGHNRNCRDSGLLEEMRLEYYLKRSPDSDSRHHWDSILMDACKREANLTVLTKTPIFSCDVKDKRIISIKGYRQQREVFVEIHARQFVDNTGDGTISHQAGASYRWGREGKEEFDEPILGNDMADNKTLGCTIYGWAEKRDFPVHFEAPTWAKSYPGCSHLSHRPHTKDHLFPTVTASRDQRSIQIFWWMEWGGHLNVIEDEEEVYENLQAELFGVWDHLKNYCEEGTRKALENFELVRWSTFPLKRESRRIEGDYMITEDDLFNPKLFKDRVGFGGWPPDDHPPEGIASNEAPCDQVFLYEPYSIPYRALYSRDIGNLFLAGRCISATHVALSSIRVMNTLGILGEAVGVASAICIENDTDPRGIYESHMEELQQRLLDRDLYLIGKKSSNEKDLIPKAEISASSTLSLKCKETLGFLVLEDDTALQFPISTEKIKELRVYLKAVALTEVKWSLYYGGSAGKINERLIIKSGEISIGPGADWLAIDKLGIEKKDYPSLILVLRRNTEVSWGFAEELFHTRWAVRYEEPREMMNYHGKARTAPAESDWLFINHNGRLPDKLKQRYIDMEGLKVHGKPYITPQFSAHPVQEPYAPDSIGNGFSRAETGANIWISDISDPSPSLLMEWKAPVSLKRIELIFDSQLDYSDQMYGFPRGMDDYSIPAFIDELVRSYVLEIRNGESWTEIAREENNRNRRMIHTLSEAQSTVTLRLRILKTWGSESARVYSIKAFSS